MGEDNQTRLATVGQITILVGILIAVGFFSAYLGMRFAVRGTEVEVPSLVERNLEEAKKILQQCNLNLEVIGKRFDPKIPENGVIVQYPPAGGRIKAQHKVQVIVSLGEKQNPVPNLKGSLLRVARLVASQAGFQIGTVGEITLDGVSKEVVIQQFPPPSSEEILSPEIDVLVSSGAPASYVMPDVRGQTLNRVLLLFEKKGFRVGRIQYRSYPNLPRGTIVKQFPEPGYRLTREQSINLEVAR